MCLGGFLCLTWGGYQSTIAWAAVLFQGGIAQTRPGCGGRHLGRQSGLKGQIWQLETGPAAVHHLWGQTPQWTKRRSGPTSNSAFSGVSGVRGFKLQRLGT
jgi:hypothetical protein